MRQIFAKKSSCGVKSTATFIVEMNVKCQILELVANGHKHLVALVANLCGIAYIVVSRHRIVFVAHEWIEVAIGLAILISQVNVPVLHAVAKAHGYTVCVLPVSVVG